MAVDSTPNRGLLKRIGAYLRQQTPAQTLLAVVVGLAALKAAAPILTPLLLAFFLIAILRPLQRRLQGRMAKPVAIGLTLLTFLSVVGLFLAVLWFSSRSLLQKWPQYAQRIESYLHLVTTAELGASAVNDAPSSWLLASSVSDEALLAVGEGLTLLGAGFSLVTAYLMMGLLEVDVFDEKLHRILPGHANQHWLTVAAQISLDCRRYLLVRTGIGLLSGSWVGGTAWLFGVDFALLWAVLAFLLKYLPTLGTVLSVLLPTLFALLQFGHWQRALLFLLVVGAGQVLQGNVINPLLQSKYLTPSPLMVVFSVVFWGWLWGLIGAFLAVPLTVLLIVTCRQFDRTRWVATLLAQWEEDAPEHG